ncbi:hypothetical protein ACB092_09G037300 [Castanea dentata]
MNITNILKEFFLPISTKLLQLFSEFSPQASSSSDAVNPELPDLAARDDAVGVDPAEAALVHRHQHHMDWTDVMIGFCLTSALEIALVSVQVHTQLSATFHLLSPAILFAFVCISFSELVKSKFLVAAQVFKNFGIFFTITAFFIAVTIPFPPYLKFVTWAIYTIFVFAIFICHCLWLRVEKIINHIWAR